MPRESSRKKLKLLQALWYLKLQKAGFKDIETRGGRLKTWTCCMKTTKARYNSTQNQAKSEYYRRAGFFLHSHNFSSALEREVWELHCDGRSCSRIWKELHCKYKFISGDDEKPFLKFKINSVRRIISQLRKVMRDHFQDESQEEWNSEGETSSGN